jgi:hypothetical protein
MYEFACLVVCHSISEPIVGLIEKGFDRVSLERKGTDNRDGRIAPAFWVHFG